MNDCISMLSFPSESFSVFVDHHSALCQCHLRRCFRRYKCFHRHGIPRLHQRHRPPPARPLPFLQQRLADHRRRSPLSTTVLFLFLFLSHGWRLSRWCSGSSSGDTRQSQQSSRRTRHGAQLVVVFVHRNGAVIEVQQHTDPIAIRSRALPPLPVTAWNARSCSRASHQISTSLPSQLQHASRIKHQASTAHRYCSVTASQY